MLMLLVANAKYKMMQKAKKLQKPWHMATQLRALSESFPMNTHMMGLDGYSLHPSGLDGSSLSIGKEK